MSHTASQSITHEHKSYYPASHDIKRTGVRSRSGSQAIPDSTDRVPQLPKGFHATKLDHIDGHHDPPTHRRTPSKAFNNSQTRAPMAMRRQSADIRPPLPHTMLDAPVHIDNPPRSRLRTFYDNNRGLAYVLLAQVFGCLMNVTTRLLEIEGNHGEGMHPFQVKHHCLARGRTLC